MISTLAASRSEPHLHAPLPRHIGDLGLSSQPAAQVSPPSPLAHTAPPLFASTASSLQKQHMQYTQHIQHNQHIQHTQYAQQVQQMQQLAVPMPSSMHHLTRASPLPQSATAATATGGADSVQAGLAVHALTSPPAPAFSSFAAMFGSPLSPAATVSLFDEAELQRRRARHNFIERRRRESLNQVIQRIHDAMPELAASGSVESDGEDGCDGECEPPAVGSKRRMAGGRPSKSKILRRALEYIVGVQQRIAALETELARHKHRGAGVSAGGRPRAVTRVYPHMSPLSPASPLSAVPARCRSVGLPRLPPCSSIAAVMVSPSQSQPASASLLSTGSQQPQQSPRMLEHALAALPPGYSRLPLPVPSKAIPRSE